MYTERTLPILESLLAALTEAHNDLIATGDGMSDAALAAISSKGTVAKLRALIVALPFKERHKAKRDFIVSALDDASGRLFLIGAIGTVTATPTTSGGSLADDDYFFRVTAVDRFGNETLASAEATATVSGGSGSGKVTLSVPATRGAVTFRVYCSLTTGVYTGYIADTANAAITGSARSIVITDISSLTAGTIPTTSIAAKGYLEDIDVETTQAAGSDNFNTLYNLIAAQHPLGATAMAGFQGAIGAATYNTAGSLAP